MAKAAARLLTTLMVTAGLGVVLVSCAAPSAQSSPPPESASTTVSMDASPSPTANATASTTDSPTASSKPSDASTAETPAPLSPGATPSALDNPDAGYLDVKETFGIVSSDDREDYGSDVAYANYRELSGGKLKRGILHRSASPIDNIYGRVPYVGKLIEADNVRFVLDLADNTDAIWDFAADNAANGVDDSYFMGLYETDNVTCLGLSTDYETEGYGETLAYGLSRLAEHDGPYLIHCMVGKDRTGLACALLEALAGATYDEIAFDYMITYDNYYGITEAGMPVQYRAIKTRNLDPILRFITGANAGEDLTAIDYPQAARTFLRDHGMDDAQIDKLVERICD